MAKQSPASADKSASSAVRSRIDVIDLLRGIAILLMALDHVREFLQLEQFSPIDLNQPGAHPALFLTRWVTHFCAPIFVFLAGAGIFLGLSQDQSRWRQARFVLVRGVWLVLLELTLVHLGWQFNFQFNSALGQVIWVIGLSMICMSLLLFLPTWLVTAIGLVLILTHNGYDNAAGGALFGKQNWIWTVLHGPGFISFPDVYPDFIGYWKTGSLKPYLAFSMVVAYPLIPWLGVMAVGFGFGGLLKQPPESRNRLIAGMGLAMIVLFAVYRGGNIYGDPAPWTRQPARTAAGGNPAAAASASQPPTDPLLTACSILNCQKYPPSLSFLLMTLGPTLLVWPLLERCRGPVADFIITFGRVPLFFYIVHLPVIHALAMAWVYHRLGKVPDWLFQFPAGYAQEGAGLSLPYLYLVWLGVVLLFYPVCRWYAGVKRKYPRSLLRFL